MERFFQILAVILIGVAAYFLQRGSRDAMFVTAVFAAVSFFLSIRFQVKGRLRQREIEREEMEKRKAEEAEEDDFLAMPGAADERAARENFEENRAADKTL
jgi:hypothetical protein